MGEQGPFWWRVPGFGVFPLLGRVPLVVVRSHFWGVPLVAVCSPSWSALPLLGCVPPFGLHPPFWAVFLFLGCVPPFGPCSYFWAMFLFLGCVPPFGPRSPFGHPEFTPRQCPHHPLAVQPPVTQPRVVAENGPRVPHPPHQHGANVSASKVHPAGRRCPATASPLRCPRRQRESGCR